MISQLEVRLRRPGEYIPPELMVGLEALNIIEDWQWLVLDGDKIVAQILTAPAHGLLILLRMMSLPEAPRGWAVLALRRLLADARARGLIACLVLLEDAHAQEVKMMRIVQKAGGILRPFCGSLAVVSTECKY